MNMNDEDYLDKLLNSVLNGEEAGDDIFDEEIKQTDFEDELFSDEEQEQNIRDEIQIEKLEEPEDAEAIAQDDMQGLMDILGISEEEEAKEELEELENQNPKKKKKRKKRFLKKKQDSNGKEKEQKEIEKQNLELALDLMENQSEENDRDMEADDGLSELFQEMPEDTYEELEQEVRKEKKEKKKKKKKKKKVKPKKTQKPKKTKKPKKIRVPREKAPAEMIPFSTRALVVLLSLAVLFLLAVVCGGFQTHYQNTIKTSSDAYVNQDYKKAYEELLTVNVKEEDKYFFGQVQTVMYVYQNYESYEKLIELGNYKDALDSLLNGVRMFDKYKDTGREEYNCFDDMNVVLSWIVEALQENYGINESQAREITLLGKGRDYAYQVAELAAQAQERILEQNDNNN